MRTGIIGTFISAMPVPASPPLRAMVLDGEQAGPHHAWRETTPYLAQMLDDAGLFQVDVVTAPAHNGDFDNFYPDWDRYHVVVLNYDAPDERWPRRLKESFEQYVRLGGGLVCLHAANNAFPNWTEYNRMIGVGGWRGRDERAGPHFYYHGGKLVRDDAPGPAGSHGDPLPFQVVNRVTDHPITNGLPLRWMHAADELYGNLRGPGENMTVLSTAWSDPANGGTGVDEPVLMVIQYGLGRVFHSVLGHDLAALNCVGFIATFQRGAQWAATGKVTLKVPRDFPRGAKPRARLEYATPPGWNSPTKERPEFCLTE